MVMRFWMLSPLWDKNRKEVDWAIVESVVQAVAEAAARDEHWTGGVAVSWLATAWTIYTAPGCLP
jgi:hypothetical protein